MAKATAQCGTPSGYNRHRRLKEPACKECTQAANEYNKQKYRESNGVKTAKLRERYASDPEYRERILANNKRNAKKRREVHGEEVRQKANARYRERYATEPGFKEKVRTKSKKYFAENPEKRREYLRLRNYRRRSNSHEPYTEKQVLETYGTDCHICGESVDLKAARKCGQPGWQRGLHIDHLVSLSMGGSDCLENVRPAHGICNVTKGAKTP